MTGGGSDDTQGRILHLSVILCYLLVDNVRKFVAELKKVNPQVEKNIFRSVENVNVNTVIAYKDNEGVHRFTDSYDLSE